MDGDHDIDRCFEVTEATLRETYRQLALQRVVLEGTLLKPNMVLSGGSAKDRADAEEVAEKVGRVLQEVRAGRRARLGVPVRGGRATKRRP